jgi:hypothetical protein
MPLETVADTEQVLSVLMIFEQKFEGQASPPPPPGTTLIQTGRGAGFDSCGCPTDHIDAHYLFRISSYASRSGDERYWTPEVVLAFYPLRRDCKTLESFLLRYPDMSAQEGLRIAMRLSKMPLWNETRKDISSEVTDSITIAYLGGKSHIRKGTVAGLNRATVARLNKV